MVVIFHLFMYRIVSKSFNIRKTCQMRLVMPCVMCKKQVSKPKPLIKFVSHDVMIQFQFNVPLVKQNEWICFGWESRNLFSFVRFWMLNAWLNLCLKTIFCHHYRWLQNVQWSHSWIPIVRASIEIIFWCNHYSELTKLHKKIARYQ